MTSRDNERPDETRLDEINPDIKKWFRKGRWVAGGGETHSGAGSTLLYTEKLRNELPLLLEHHRVKTLLDAPCGDFNWMRAIDLGDVQYIGMDIADDIVSEVRTRYESDRRRFIVGDITRTRLPRVDLMLCRDCLFHLMYSQIEEFFDNFRRSKIPLLLLTSHHIAKNRDIERAGRFRQLNMRKEPFGLPEPLAAIDDWIEGHPRRYVGLWNREQVLSAM